MKNRQEKQAKQIEQLWERGIEQAQADTVQESPLNAETLNVTAGLHLQSSVRAGGLWGTTGSCTCGQTCSQHCVE